MKLRNCVEGEVCEPASTRYCIWCVMGERAGLSNSDTFISTSSSLRHVIHVSRYTCITCHLELECGHCQLGSWSRAAVHEVEVQGEPRQ